MNPDISNIAAAQAAPPATKADRPRVAQTVGAQRAVIVDTIPPTPPAEVLQQIAAAAITYEKLIASGIQLHFETDPTTGKLAVQVMDRHGRVVGTVPASKVLDAASGGTLD